MAFTTSDLTAIESAIASGELTVRYADGKEVTYRSIGELMKARDLIKSVTDSTIATSTRFTYASFTKD
jgi:hypothetical protein